MNYKELSSENKIAAIMECNFWGSSTFCVEFEKAVHPVFCAAMTFCLLLCRKPMPECLHSPGAVVAGPVMPNDKASHGREAA